MGRLARGDHSPGDSGRADENAQHRSASVRMISPGFCKMSELDLRSMGKQTRTKSGEFYTCPSIS